MKNRYFYFNILRKSYVFTIKQAKKILGLNDSPHAIGLGVAIGMFIAFTPTIPLQMTISFIIAWICRANKAATLPPAWVTNPITAPPIFFAEYLTGVYILKLFSFEYDVVGKEKYTKGIEEVLKLDIYHISELFPQLIALTVKTWEKIGPPLLLGSLIWSTIIGVAFYFITYKFVEKRRERKRKKIQLMKMASNSPEV